MNTVTQQVIATTRDYWRIYHSADLLARFDSICTSYDVQSTDVRLNVDAYEQPDASAPVVIINHGGGGYSRLFIPQALTLYDRGYTVLLPDQRGQGLSAGSRSDFTLGQFVQNIVDVAQWARVRYSGTLFMTGGSVGGALTYMAAAAGAPVTAIVCHNLYDFGNPSDTLAVSSFAPLANIPGVPQLVARMTGAMAAVVPGMLLPYRLLAKFDKMVDERAVGFFEQWQRDPYPIREISLRYMASLSSTPPAIPFEDNTIPVLVINPTLDEMTPPSVTEANYQRLGGPKQYAEIAYGHWAMGEAFTQEWVALVDKFLKQYR